jgi:nucleoside-diphosphate-sugar epimerase
VLGAGGWFGRTLIDDGLLNEAHEFHLVGRTRRNLRFGGRNWPINTWDEASVKAFAPTVVFNFAFLTREKELELGIEEFVARNNVLSERFLWATQLPSVKFAMTVSSGVARDDHLLGVTFEKEPYGHLKRSEEKDFLSQETPVTKIVLRAFAVSGPHVFRPLAYAFSDFILQAQAGSIHIKSARPTYRAYVSVSDALTLVTRLWSDGKSGVFETGGALIEMGELADAVRRTVNPEASIERLEFANEKPEIYASTDGSWDLACLETDFQPMDLYAQIKAAAAGLRVNK